MTEKKTIYVAHYIKLGSVADKKCHITSYVDWANKQSR